MMNGYDRIIVATSYILHIMENPKWQWLKYIRVYLSYKSNWEVAHPELVWWLNGRAPFVFLFFATYFQPQSNLRVQYGCWSFSRHGNFPGSKKEKQQKECSSQLSWLSSRSLPGRPIQCSVYNWQPTKNPFGVWMGIALNLWLNMKKVSIFTFQLLESYPSVFTLGISCTTSTEETGCLSKKYHKNAHCSFCVLIQLSENSAMYYSVWSL